jgi:CheY-like chemotaxis protein
VADLDAEAELRRRHAGARVLLAEDNPVNQDVAIELLQAAGLVVDVAGNGLQALALVQRGGHDLVLMDMQMPEMDGLETTRRIRALSEHAALPIIAMTANAFGEDRAECLAAGMDDHVGKPVDPAQLYSTLLRWLPGGRAGGGTPLPWPGTAPATAPLPGAVGLPVLAGLDVEQALHNMGGSVAAYCRVLRQFALHYAAGLPELLDLHAEAETDAEIWRRCAHSVKGAALAVGARRLPALATALEVAAAVSPAAAAAAAEVLQSELVALAATIQAALPQDEAPASALAQGAPVVAPAALERLAALVAAADFEALEVCRTLGPALRAQFGAAAIELDGALGRFDYESAGALLRRMRGA